MRKLKSLNHFRITNTHKLIAPITLSIAFGLYSPPRALATPVNPDVKSIAQHFSQVVQSSFLLYADSEDENKVWYVSRFGSIALTPELEPGIAIDTYSPDDGLFQDRELVKIEGTLDTTGIASELARLDREAKALGYHIAPIPVETANTTFLLAGFALGNNGRIDAECEFVPEFTIEGIVEVPYCQAVDKDGIVRPLDFLYQFTSQVPEGGLAISQQIPFSGISLPGWREPIQNILEYGNNWDQYFQVMTNWSIKADQLSLVAKLAVNWRTLFQKVANYLSGCEWACTESEVDHLFDLFIQTPGNWGLNLQYRQTDGSYGPNPVDLEQQLQVREELVTFLTPELFVSFVDEVPVPTDNGFTNIGPLAEASASSTYCSGPNPSTDCYDPSRANDGIMDTALGGFTSWSNDLLPLPQWLQLSWDEKVQLNAVTVVTSEGYPVSDFNLEFYDEESGEWQVLAEITDNVDLRVPLSFEPVDTRRLRVVGKRGPDHQTNHVRINEVVVSGRELTPLSSPIQRLFYTLRANIEKLVLTDPENFDLSSGESFTLKNASTLMYLQCLTGGFGEPVTWYDAPRCAYSIDTNLAPLAEASASSTYCSGVNPSMHCYDPARANDGVTDTALGGFTSWANDRSTSLPQWWQASWPKAVRVGSVTVYTSLGYPIKDYDIQYYNAALQQWETIKEVRGNTDLVVHMDFPPITTTRLRISGRSGPDHQSGYVRLNEVVIEGRLLH